MKYGSKHQRPTPLPCFLALLRTCFGSAALIHDLVGNAQKTWSCRRSSRNSCQALQSFPVLTAKRASNHLLQLSIGSEGFAAISSRRSAFRKLGIALGSGDMRAQHSILGQVCPPQRSRSAAKYSASAVQGQRQPGHACHKMRPGKCMAYPEMPETPGSAPARHRHWIEPREVAVHHRGPAGLDYIPTQVLRSDQHFPERYMLNQRNFGPEPKG